MALPDAYEEEAWVGTRWRVRKRTFAHVLTVEGGSRLGAHAARPTHGRARPRSSPFRAAGEELSMLAQRRPPVLLRGLGSRRGRDGARGRHRLGRGGRARSPRATACWPPRSSSHWWIGRVRARVRRVLGRCREVRVCLNHGRGHRPAERGRPAAGRGPALVRGAPGPDPADLVDAGYVVPHWPRPWGLDAEPELQLIIDDELRAPGVARPLNPIGIGHCGPVLVVHGTEEQKERYLMPMLRGEEMWCQLFSEPEAGSDLANLSTRAVRDGDVFVVNGQKIWTSLAQVAKFGILIARTDTDTSKYTGISYFIIPMDLPGIEIRPLRNMVGGYGDAGFCEVFFTDVAVPAENLIGSLNGGWAMAKETLANERVSLSTRGPPVGLRTDRARPGRPGARPGAASTACCASASSPRTSRARSCATTSSGRSRRR